MSTPKALSLTIRDDDTLCSAYMPWLSGGGLFVPTEHDYHIGQRVYLLIMLPGESERLPVEGEVVWLTPVGAGQRAAGIGVRFGAGDGALRERIESRLASAEYRGSVSSHTL